MSRNAIKWGVRICAVVLVWYSDCDLNDMPSAGLAVDLSLSNSDQQAGIFECWPASLDPGIVMCLSVVLGIAMMRKYHTLCGHRFHLVNYLDFVRIQIQIRQKGRRERGWNLTHQTLSAQRIQSRKASTFEIPMWFVYLHVHQANNVHCPTYLGSAFISVRQKTKFNAI